MDKGKYMPTLEREAGAVGTMTAIKIGVVSLALMGGTAVMQNAENGPTQGQVEATSPLDGAQLEFLKAAQESPVQVETNETLALGEYGCGVQIEYKGTDTGKMEFGYNDQIDFLNKNPELSKKVAEAQINDPKYGMQKGWEVIQEFAYGNENTDPTKKVEANADLDEYAHLLFTVIMDEEIDVLNFSCANDEIKVASQSTIKTTNAVSGFLVNESDVAKFTAAAPQGGKYFNIISVGMVDVKGVPTKMSMIQTESYGCKNMARKLQPAPATPTDLKLPASPKAPESSPPMETTSPSPSRSPEVTPSPSRSPEVTPSPSRSPEVTPSPSRSPDEEKKDDGVLPTLIPAPAERDPGSGDPVGAGKGEAGQTRNPRGTLPTEEAPTQEPYVPVVEPTPVETTRRPEPTEAPTTGAPQPVTSPEAVVTPSPQATATQPAVVPN